MDMVDDSDDIQGGDDGHDDNDNDSDQGIWILDGDDGHDFHKGLWRQRWS